MYCRDCGSNQKTTKTRDKAIYAHIETWFCKKCGAQLHRLEDHRRKDLR